MNNSNMDASATLTMAAQLNNQGIQLVETLAIADPSSPSSPAGSKKRKLNGAITVEDDGPSSPMETGRQAVQNFRQAIQLFKNLVVELGSEPDAQHGEEQEQEHVQNPRSTPECPLSFVATINNDDEAAVEASIADHGISKNKTTLIQLDGVQSFASVDCLITFPTQWVTSMQQQLRSSSFRNSPTNRALLLSCCTAIMINVGILSHRLTCWQGLSSRKRDEHIAQATNMYSNALRCMDSIDCAVDGGSNTMLQDIMWTQRVIATNNLAILSLTQRNVADGAQQFAQLRILFHSRWHSTTSAPSLIPSSVMKVVLLNLLMSRGIAQFMTAAAAA